MASCMDTHDSIEIGAAVPTLQGTKELMVPNEMTNHCILTVTWDHILCFWFLTSTTLGIRHLTIAQFQYFSMSLTKVEDPLTIYVAKRTHVPSNILR